MKRILVVEDDRDLRFVIRMVLERGGYEPRWRRVDSIDDLHSALSESWDIVISDDRVPVTPLQVLQALRDRKLDVPLIVISDTVDEAAMVEDAGDAGSLEPAEPKRAVQYFLQLLVPQRRVGVDERQGDLAVQRRVERLPELQVGRPAVEDKQPVAATADSGARNEVHVFIRGRGLDRWFTWNVERQALAGGVAAVIGGRSTRCRR